RRQEFLRGPARGRRRLALRVGRLGRLGRGRGGLGLAVRLPLRSLGRLEQLGERALTHAGALSRHSVPPSQAPCTPRQRFPSDRTSEPTRPLPAPPRTG